MKIKGRTAYRAEVGKKRKSEGSSGNKKNKKKKFLKLENNNKSRRNHEGKWCKQCKKKHFGDYDVCYKCKKLGLVSSNYLLNGKVCYNYGEEGNMKVECPKAEKPTPKILSANPKG